MACSVSAARLRVSGNKVPLPKRLYNAERFTFIVNCHLPAGKSICCMRQAVVAQMLMAQLAVPVAWQDRSTATRTE